MNVAVTTFDYHSLLSNLMIFKAQIIVTKIELCKPWIFEKLQRGSEWIDMLTRLNFTFWVNKPGKIYITHH